MEGIIWAPIDQNYDTSRAISLSDVSQHAYADKSSRFFLKCAQRLLRMNIPKHIIWFWNNRHRRHSAAVLAEMLLRSPGKLFIFIIKEYIYRIKVFKNEFIYFWKKLHYGQAVCTGSASFFKIKYFFLDTLLQKIFFR